MLSMVTFSLAEVKLQDSLEQWVSVEAEVKVRAHFWLLGAFHPLVLRGRHPLDERVWDLHTNKQTNTMSNTHLESSHHKQSQSSSLFENWEKAFVTREERLDRVKFKYLRIKFEPLEDW